MKMLPIGEQLLIPQKRVRMIIKGKPTPVHQEAGKYNQAEHTIHWAKEESFAVCGSFPVWKLYGGMAKPQNFSSLGSRAIVPPKWKVVQSYSCDKGFFGFHFQLKEDHDLISHCGLWFLGTDRLYLKFQSLVYGSWSRGRDSVLCPSVDKTTSSPSQPLGCRDNREQDREICRQSWDKNRVVHLRLSLCWSKPWKRTSGSNTASNWQLDSNTATRLQAVFISV